MADALAVIQPDTAKGTPIQVYKYKPSDPTPTFFTEFTLPKDKQSTIVIHVTDFDKEFQATFNCVRK